MTPRIGILGAGSIGAFLGLRLAAAGFPVVLVGRADLVRRRTELVARDLRGASSGVSPGLVTTTDPAALADCELVLITVKSGDTASAGAALAPVLRAGATVVSLQNGLRNPGVLAAALGRPAVGGMVFFNVVRDGPSFRQATDGPLLVAKGSAGAATLVQALAKAGLDAGLHADLPGVQAGKLLLNLNNGVCAATGLPIAASLRSRTLRRCFAACLVEGARVMKASGIRPARIGALAPGLVARVLPLPDAVFLRVARRLVAIDPGAKSSTLQDLERGRATEIDFLNGEIATLARDHGTTAPLNEALTRLVHGLERLGTPPPFLSPEALTRELGLAPP